MRKEQVICANEIIQLDVDRDTINPEEIIGGIIIPFSKDNALTKTITCKVKNINPITEKKYNIHIGDEVLVDRYAIITQNLMKDKDKEFRAFIKMNSVILVKRNNA